MNGEAIGGLIISLLAFGAVIWVIRYFRERNSCPRCRDASPPQTVQKHRHSFVKKDKRQNLFFCPRCHDEWWTYDETANICSNCEDGPTPWLMSEDRPWLGSKENDKQDKETTPWGDLVRCKACRHEWRRIPLNAAGGQRRNRLW